MMTTAEYIEAPMLDRRTPMRGVTTSEFTMAATKYSATIVVRDEPIRCTMNVRTAMSRMPPRKGRQGPAISRQMRNCSTIATPA